MTMEKRTFTLNELRAVDQATPRRLRGMAVVYDQPADVGGKWLESIRPGALTRSLKTDRDIKARFEHRDLLGSTINNTLRLTDTPEGLAVEIDVAETRAGDDVLALVDRGDIRGMSFGFLVPEGGETWTREGDKVHRLISDLDLYEVTVTDSPVFAGTSVSLRSASPEAIAHAAAMLAELNTDTPPTLAERRGQLRRHLAAV